MLNWKAQQKFYSPHEEVLGKSLKIGQLTKYTVGVHGNPNSLLEGDCPRLQRYCQWETATSF
jgi:hypothetical protein